MNRIFHYRETTTLIKCATLIGILTYGEVSILDAVVQVILNIT